MFTSIIGKPVCLLCGAEVAVLKEYNLRQQYTTKHEDRHKDLNTQQKLNKVEEIKQILVSQQCFKKQNLKVRLLLKLVLLWHKKSLYRPVHLQKESLSRTA